MKAVQESSRHKLEEMRNKSKVTMKSHQLAYKKLERDIENAVKYVDYEDVRMLNMTQVG